jgi:hypothetical protein
MSASGDTEDLPPQLGIAAQLQAKNTEYNLDMTGRVTHLNEKSLITSFPVEIPAGTVLFSIIDIPQNNVTVRGLIRVASQSEESDIGGFRTIADFVDLNTDERRKIRRLLKRSSDDVDHPPARAAVLDDQGALSRGHSVPSAPPARQARAPEQPAPVRVTLESVIWIVLAVIFYSMVLLGIVAIFPQGRAIELVWLAKLLHAVDRVWPGFSHLLRSK